MPFLTQSQRELILQHMIDPGNSSTLNSKYKAKKLEYDMLNVELNELEGYIQAGWEEYERLKRKARVQKKKECGRLFEDNIWTMFYELGFKILNLDENLVVPWGPEDGQHKQLDVVAVGDDAIFVVECKATDKQHGKNFKTELDSIKLYKEGVTRALQEIYGPKKVKFIFATRGYTFSESSEDLKRMKEMKVFHFNENAYNYVKALIEKYTTSVMYQFMGLMFKDELNNDEKIRIPALRGSMGGHDYYMLSIEPEKLLKIGFVLHRTKVNDFSAPTYQRLLVPSRLKGITKFIDEGGYFPNSIIVNFDVSGNKKMKIQFESAGKVGDTDARHGTLIIPNAYGIAYIIDGQHRVYGYAGSQYKNSNTIPVVAFQNMESQEQLKIFMDINENQKAVSPNLRLDLAEDLYWNSPNIDSRMLALRSSIIKELSRDSNGPLFQKISVGEDKADLTFKPFELAFKASGFLPKGSKKSYTDNQDICLYDTNNHDHGQEMYKAKRRISSFVKDALIWVKNGLSQDTTYDTFIECNRGMYAFIVVLGSINSHLIRTHQIDQLAQLPQRMEAVKPYLGVLINYLNNIPESDRNDLILMRGQGADTTWVRLFQNAIHNQIPEYNPEGLTEWLQTQDKELQEQGKQIGEEIESLLKERVLAKLKDLFGDAWRSSVQDIRLICQNRMIEAGEDLDTTASDWTDYLQPADYHKIIEKHWIAKKDDDPSFATFAEEFTLFPTESTSKKERLKWLTDFINLRKSWTTSKNSHLTQANVNSLQNILYSMSPSEDEM